MGTVYYCCVCNVGTVMYEYYNSSEDHEIKNLASLCLQKAPSYHKWYFQTMFNKSFVYLMEDGYVYFAIFDGNVDGCKKREFLERVRDEFKKVAKKLSKKRMLSKPNLVQEQMLPVVRRLVSSLENVAESGVRSPYNDTSSDNSGVSTKAPLLGKSKQDKRKMRDHVVTVRESGVVEEHRKSADRQGGSKVDSSSRDVNIDGGSVVGMSLVKEVSSMSRSRTQIVRKKWCRQIRIVLAIDVAVCLVLFVVWMVVCRGTECIR